METRSERVAGWGTLAPRNSLVSIARWFKGTFRPVPAVDKVIVDLDKAKAIKLIDDEWKSQVRLVIEAAKDGLSRLESLLKLQAEG